MAFIEFNHRPNFVLDDFLADVIPRSESHGYQRPSQMDCVCNEIANSLMKK
jgi:hypothetical protein